MVPGHEIFQTEIVLPAWRMGIQIIELPIEIKEIRAPSVKIVSRVPKIINMISELRKSIKRFPQTPDQSVVQVKSDQI